MSETIWTPGPWCVADGDVWTESASGLTPGIPLLRVARDCPTWARGWRWPTEEEFGANAAIAAAAPDLYEVAKAYEQWEADLILNDRTWSDGVPCPTQEQWDRLLEIQAMRNAALAKATVAPAQGSPQEDSRSDT